MKKNGKNSSKAIRRIEHSRVNATVGLVTSILMGLFSFAERTVFNQFFIEDYLGLFSFNYNIIYTLNYIEMGLSTSIAFALYKPLDENNREQIAAIMQFFHKAYIVIGCIILSCGFLILPFIDKLVNTTIPIEEVKTYFIIFLLAQTSSYFICYKSILFTANQDNYKITLITNLTWTILYLVEIAIAATYQNFMYYSISILCAHLIKNTIIRFLANHEFSYLKHERKTGIDKPVLDAIKKNTVGMAINKLGQVLVTSTDSVLISALVGTAFLGKYTNYMMIISGLRGVTSIIPTSITDSIGNAGVSETKRTLSDGFYTINVGYFFVYSIVTVLLVNVANPIVSTFFGSSRLLPDSTLYLLCFSFYLSCMREILFSYKSSLGLYWEDRKRPILEGITNFITSFILGKKIGINGIIIGTIISQVFINLVFEPRVIFHSGLRRSTIKYYFHTINSTLITLLMVVVSIYICSKLNIEETISYSIIIGGLRIEIASLLQIAVNAIISIIVSTSLLFVFYRNSVHARKVFETLKIAFRTKNIKKRG